MRLYGGRDSSHPGAERKRKNSYKKDMDKTGCINNFISVKTCSGYHGEQVACLHTGEWKSGILLDLNLQGKINRLIKKILVKLKVESLCFNY